MFHNLRGYDGHLLIKAVNKKHGRVRVIPTNMEKFMAISIGQLQFLDSLQFTMKSLEDLVKTLDDNDFTHTRQAFKTDEKFCLMKRKGIFPYDFFDDSSKLTSNEEMNFPSRETFFNKLMDEECTMKVSLSSYLSILINDLVLTFRFTLMENYLILMNYFIIISRIISMENWCGRPSNVRPSRATMICT